MLQYIFPYQAALQLARQCSCQKHEILTSAKKSINSWLDQGFKTVPEVNQGFPVSLFARSHGNLASHVRQQRKGTHFMQFVSVSLCKRLPSSTLDGFDDVVWQMGPAETWERFPLWMNHALIPFLPVYAPIGKHLPVFTTWHHMWSICRTHCCSHVITCVCYLISLTITRWYFQLLLCTLQAICPKIDIDLSN